MKRSAKDLTTARDASLKENLSGPRKSARRLIPVRFEFAPPEAIPVSVAGSFNNWHPLIKSLQPVGSGYWSLEAFLAPVDYGLSGVAGTHYCMCRNQPRQRIALRRTICH